MKSIDEIIGRAENLLCIMDRCGLENSICDRKRYTKRQRNEQCLVIYKWLRIMTIFGLWRKLKSICLINM